MGLKEVGLDMRATWSCLLAATACMGGSAGNAPIPMLGIDSAEYAGYRTEGTLDLKGQAFLTTRSEEVKLAAGRVVTLDPATQMGKQACAVSG